MTVIQQILDETDVLFEAILTVGNEAYRQSGYNNPFEFASGLTATYELFDKGPERLHYGQYSYLNDLECGVPVDPSQELAGDDLFWAMQKVYRRITIKDGEKAVCRIEGPGIFKMSLYFDGAWETQLREWFKEDGGVLR